MYWWMGRLGRLGRWVRYMERWVDGWGVIMGVWLLFDLTRFMSLISLGFIEFIDWNTHRLIWRIDPSASWLNTPAISHYLTAAVYYNSLWFQEVGAIHLKRLQQHPPSKKTQNISILRSDDEDSRWKNKCSTSVSSNYHRTFFYGRGLELQPDLCTRALILNNMKGFKP